MANTNMLKARGLQTFANYLSSIPEGSLLKAKNTVIDRDGVIEPRRGFGQYGEIGASSSDVSKQLLTYKDRILAHYGTKIAFDNGSGVFTDFTSDYTETETGLRIKSIEINGNLYLTTNEGVKKISATSAATLGSAVESLSGAIRAANIYAYPDYSSAGFLLEYAKVAYRVVWGTKDNNENLLLGYPSERYEVINSAPTSCNVTLEITAPQDATDNYFYQVYRTNVAQIADLISIGQLNRLADISAGDEMRLVYESAYDGVTPTITFDDVTPEDFRDGGTPLYTNEISGEGIGQANSRPPYAKDIALYKNTMFLGNTKTFQNFNLALLGLGDITDFEVSSIVQSGADIEVTTVGNHNLSVNDYAVILGSTDASVDGTHQVNNVGAANKFKFTGTILGIPVAASTSVYTSYVIISRGITTERYFIVGRPEIWELDFTPHTIVASDYFKLYSLNDEKTYVFWYEVNLVGSDPLIPGAISKKIVLPAAPTAAQAALATKTAIEESTFDFYVSLDVPTDVLTILTATSGTASNPNMGTTGITLSVVQDGFGENAANKYIRKSSLASPSQQIDDTARSFAKIVTSESAMVDAHYVSSTSDTPGKMYLEDRELSDAPFYVAANNDDVGALFNPNIADPVASTNEIASNRLYYSKYSQPDAVPSLNYIDVGPKDKAIVRVVGLRDSLFVFKEEAVYRLTGDNSSNFSVTIFDNSANIIAPDSCAILNNQIYVLTTQGVATISETGVQIISRPIENLILKASNPNYTNFKVSSFALSSEVDRAYVLFTVDKVDDEVATVAYRYNTFTQAWTSWDKSATCGISNASDNQIYLGASDLNLVEKERKNLSRRDYADRQYPINFVKNSLVNNVVGVTSTTNIEDGDVLVQTQKLTISQLNTLLRKLDLDPLMKHPSIADYFTQEIAEAGDDLNDNLLNLVVKLLVRDPSGGYAYSVTPNFTNMQSQYNTDIIQKLNASVNVFFTNYSESLNSVDYEIRVQDVNNINKRVTAAQVTPIIIGETVVHKSIKTEVIWAPIHFGEPNVMKQVRESTLMLENTALEGAIFGFNTDLSANFEDIAFALEGDGVYGANPWSSFAWGGEGSAVPFRTYVPRAKQRCRFIRARFKSSSAFDKFAILGISYTFEGVSERAYK